MGLGNLFAKEKNIITTTIKRVCSIYIRISAPSFMQ